MDKLEQTIKDIELGLRIAKVTDCGLFKTSVKSAEQILELLKEKQPKKGEWIITGRKNIYGSIEIKCPCCSDTVMVQHIEDELFCRHCGADMRKDGEQE